MPGGLAPHAALLNVTMAPEIDRFAIAAELFPDQPPGFPLDEESFDLREVQLPAGDDLGIRSDDDEGDEGDMQTETGFGSVLGEALCCPQPPHATVFSTLLN